MAEPTAAAGAVNGAPAAPAAGVSAFSQRDAQHHLGSAAAPPNATVAQSFTEGAIPLHHLLAPLHAPHSPRNSPGHQGRPSRPRDDTAGLTHMPSIRHRRHELHISDQELLPTLIAKYHIKEAKAFSSAKDAVAYAKRVYDTGCEVRMQGVGRERMAPATGRVRGVDLERCCGGCCGQLRALARR